MVTDTYQRYLWLLNTLLRCKRLTFKEIAEKWDNSSLNDDGKPLKLRTFHLHKTAIQDLFNITISCDSAAGYVYFIDEKASEQADSAHRWMLNSFNVGTLVRDARAMRDKVLLEEIPGGTEYLETIIEALKECHELKVLYRRYGDNEAQVYHCNPYCLKVYNQHWYMLGYLSESNAIHPMALDRMLEVSDTGVKFKYPEDFLPADYYHHAVGIFVKEKEQPQRVVIRAYKDRVPYLRALPIHHSQKEINTTADYSDFEYWLCESPDLLREILSRGPSVEVLEPESLRKQVKGTILSMLNLYKKKISL
ncbi:MAG: WYL domain-containing protein [Bacteroidales bacterium]|nr:WYL domain-containing protein [Bacteroidales bacterium]